jgi:hypothetical protein
MTDPYRSPDTSPTSHRPAPARPGAVRPLLWLVLAVCAAVNMATSAAGVNMMISAGFGLVALGCAAALIVGHVRRGRT